MPTVEPGRGGLAADGATGVDLMAAATEPTPRSLAAGGGRTRRPGAADLGRCAVVVAAAGEPDDQRDVDVALVSDSGEIVASQRLSAAVSVAAGAAQLSDAVDAVLHAVGLEPAQAAALGGAGVVVGGTVPADGWQRMFGERYRLPVTTIAAQQAMVAAEHWRGAALGRRSALAVVLGATVQGALVVDGHLVGGTTGNAGHIGHICVDPYGPRCDCGSRGCLQAVAGSAAIAAWARRNDAGTFDGQDAATPAVAAMHVVQAAQRGQPVARATLRRAGEAIGQAIAGTVILLDLDVVVITGPLAAAGPVLFDPIDDAYHRYARLGYAAPARTVPGTLGAAGLLIGAAAAVLEPTAYRTG